MANWIKAITGNYVNLDKALTVKIRRKNDDSAKVFRVLCRFGNIDEIIYEGPEELCIDIAKEICEFTYSGLGPGDKPIKYYKRDIVFEVLNRQNQKSVQSGQ